MDMLNQLFGDLLLPPAAGDAVTLVQLMTALGLCCVLMVIIGFVYQRTHRGTLYTQDFVHALIVMGVVVTAVIMGIGQSPVAAFGIFAAFSIIRFRRALPQTRDVGFIFLAMAIGVACGAHQYALAVMTTAITSAVAVLLAGLNLFAPVRPSHMLRLRVTPDVDFEAAFAEIFQRFLDRTQLISVESVQAGMLTELNYAVRLRADARPHDLVLALQQANGNNRVILTTAIFDADDGGDD